MKLECFCPGRSSLEGTIQSIEGCTSYLLVFYLSNLTSAGTCVASRSFLAETLTLLFFTVQVINGFHRNQSANKSTITMHLLQENTQVFNSAYLRLRMCEHVSLQVGFGSQPDHFDGCVDDVRAWDKSIKSPAAVSYPIILLKPTVNCLARPLG